MRFSALWKLATVGSLLTCSATTFSYATETQVPLTYVRSILNASPNFVQTKLGKPDNGVNSTNDCTDEKMLSCDFATYKNGKFEVIFYKGRLKTIFIYGNNLFSKNAPEVIGFPSAPPTWVNQSGHSWRNAAHKGTASGPLIPIDGIDEINLTPHCHNDTLQNNNLDCIVVSVGVSYNKSFAK
jgi:hypothetical protein